MNALHWIFLAGVLLLFIDKIVLMRRISRLKQEAIHWQQAYNNGDRWSKIAMYYEKKTRNDVRSEDAYTCQQYREAFELLSKEIWGRVDESKTVGDVVSYIQVLKAAAKNS